MIKGVSICPIGTVSTDILAFLSKRISRRCGVECHFTPETENPRYAYDEVRCQYRAKTILKRLIQGCPADTIKAIGITHVDLFVPILKFVFGLSQIDGPCAVISTYRLRPEFYDQPADPDLFLARLEKTTIHELGHAFGLTHCQDYGCVMFSSTSIENTDRKKPDFCPACRDLFFWYLDQNTRKTNQ